MDAVPDQTLIETPLIQENLRRLGFQPWVGAIPEVWYFHWKGTGRDVEVIELMGDSLLVQVRYCFFVVKQTFDQTDAVRGIEAALKLAQVIERSRRVPKELSKEDKRAWKRRERQRAIDAALNQWATFIAECSGEIALAT